MKLLNTSTRSLVSWMSLVLAAPAFGEPASGSEAERYERRCLSHAPTRGSHNQGTMLWGTRRSWRSRAGSSDQTSVVVSVNLTTPREVDSRVEALTLKDGRLVASPDSSVSLVGTVLQGTSSDGKPLELTVCGAEPSPEDPSMVWYRIEAWNPVAREWENPCAATVGVPDPRALAVSGVWDASGAHRDLPGRFTLACENGVISKCINWGYKPWARYNGESLAQVHQACTRMARADYCGNGQTHTHPDTTVDVYDRLGVLSPTTEGSPNWDPSRASFEAAWEPDGATCLAHTRDGRAVETILRECPERFRPASTTERTGGASCLARRDGVSAGPALLRNQSYGEPKWPGGSPLGQ